MRIEDLNSQPALLFPKPKDEVRFFDKDHVWVNGRQYISLKRVGEMLKEKRTTNADRIRGMDNRELAEVLLDFKCTTCDFDGFCKSKGKCKKEITEWLKSEVTE